MHKKPKDFSHMIQDFMTRSIAGQVQAAQRAYDLAMRFGRGELWTQAMYDEAVRFASQETSRYVSDLAMLGLNYYNDWLAMNQQYSKRFFEAFGGKTEAAVETGTAEFKVKEATVARRIEMELHAPVGQEAVRAFVLENKHGKTADISFVISDFTGPAGTTPMRAPIQIQPEHFRLDPGQETTVTLRLPLRAGLFDTGLRYRGTIHIEGYDNLELGLTVWADVPDSEQADSLSSAVEVSGKKRGSRKAAGREKDE